MKCLCLLLVPSVSALNELRGLRMFCIVVQVLVHAAAGGVGQAAVHIMAAAGSRVVATAGGPEKRMAVRALGVRAVAGSRDTGFAEVLGCGGMAGMLSLQQASMHRPSTRTCCQGSAGRP